MLKRKEKKLETLRVLDPRAERTRAGTELPKPVCMTIYLAAEAPLRLVDWCADTPGFFVKQLETHNDEMVRVQFAQEHVYYAGSHTHCGCGFNYGRVTEFERDAEELARKHYSMAVMSDYLAQEIGRVGEIELFACWDGDQAAAPVLRRELTPSSLRSESFFFYEKELSVIREDAA